MNNGDQIWNLNDWLKSGFLLGLRHDTFLVGSGTIKRHKTLPKGQPALFASDFFLEDQFPWWTFEHLAILSKEDLKHQVGTLARPLPAVVWQPADESAFESDFAAIQNAIEMGVLEKAVPVTFETAKLDIDAGLRASLIRNLLENHGDRTVYGLWQDQFGILGASPEVLFTCNEVSGELETMALAGTRKTDDEKQISLLLDPKEMFEHNVVIHDIKRKLKALGDLKIDGPRVWDLGLISHLRTDIQVQIKKPANRSSGKLIQLMHPTPALGIASESQTFKWLKNLSYAETRARFGAPFGVARYEGKTEVIVGIRNIQWAGDDVLLGSGCGIVAPSNFEREWRELGLKRQSVKALFKL